jgi:hypothetical protein
MKVKKILSFTEEEIQIIIDFSEKIVDATCKTLEEDCVRCPFNDYCCRIGGFVETVFEKGYWTKEEEES